MRSYLTWLILCTMVTLPAALAQIPANTALALVDGPNNDNDSVKLIDPATDDVTDHSLPYSHCSAIAVTYEGSLLLAADDASGSAIYSLELGSSGFGAPAAVQTVEDRVTTMAVVAADLVALVTDQAVYLLDLGASSVVKIVAADSNETFLDATATTEGYALLSTTSGGARLTRYLLDGSLVDITTYSDIDSALCITEITADEFMVGAGDDGGTTFGITYSSSGGSIISSNADNEPVTRIDRSPGSIYRGRATSMLVVRPAPQGDLPPMSLGGTLLDLTVAPETP